MSEEEQKVSGEEKPRAKVPGLFRNYLSFAGAAIVFASFTSILLLILLELTGAATDNPYFGIFTYIIFPGVLIFGLAVILLGMLLERRRRHRLSHDEIAAFPMLDLNDPKRRRAFFVFLGAAFIFIFMSAFGSYRAYEYTESVQFCGQTCHTVMKPEFVAFQASPHARLRCVDCHVGSGAEWYARSKINGARQLYALAFNSYQKPIPTPVHNMRPARDTCEQCHWPEKFHGDELRVFNHYAYDEQNTPKQTRMLIHVGGGSPKAGQVSGIHWHMNIANEVTYIATDEHRQTIPWIRIKDQQGNVTEYVDKNRPLTPEQIAKATPRRMDCVDCHNRPTHIYLPPDVAVDQALAANRLDASLPFLKRQAIEALTKPYTTNDEALNSIAANLDQFYRANYAELYTQKGEAVKGAISELQRIYQTYFFPEMKTDWQAHPNNIGHLYSSGCFRCHDGEHVSNTGKVISNDCNICHTVLDQTAKTAISGGEGGVTSFRHPVALGDLAALKCTVCHKADKPFQHPVNLGDISRFQCADCHTGNHMRRES